MNIKEFKFSRFYKKYLLLKYLYYNKDKNAKYLSVYILNIVYIYN